MKKIVITLEGVRIFEDLEYGRKRIIHSSIDELRHKLIDSNLFFETPAMPEPIIKIIMNTERCYFFVVFNERKFDIKWGVSQYKGVCLPDRIWLMVTDNTGKWVGAWLWAYDRKSNQLMAYPMPNIHASGSVCWGSGSPINKFTINHYVQIDGLFHNSEFNNDLLIINGEKYGGYLNLQKKPKKFSWKDYDTYYQTHKDTKKFTDIVSRVKRGDI